MNALDRVLGLAGSGSSVEIARLQQELRTAEAFHRVAVQERDLERMVADRTRAERDELKQQVEQLRLQVNQVTAERDALRVKELARAQHGAASATTGS